MTEAVAVVVGSVDVGESDRIIRLLCPDRGRTSAVARHARASRRRFGGVFELGNRVRLQRKVGKGGLDVVLDVDLVSAPRRARSELERIAALAYGCELCAALAPEEHPAPKLARLLEVWLEILEGDLAPGAPSRIALEGKALTFAGLAPALVRCASCREPLDAPVVFDPEAGGALHDRCGGGRPCDARTLARFEGLRRAPLAETVNEGPLEGTSWSWLLSDFARHHLGRDLRSRGLLEELGQATDAGRRPGG